MEWHIPTHCPTAIYEGTELRLMAISESIAREVVKQHNAALAAEKKT